MLRAIIIGLVASTAVLAGCTEFRFQGGLASVSGINHPWTGEDFAHDVIANGDESCPRTGRPEDDRLWQRIPRCGGVRFDSLSRPSLPRPEPPPVPTQGLPPVAIRRSF